MCVAPGFMGGEGGTFPKSLLDVLYILHFAFIAGPGGSKVQVKKGPENKTSRCARSSFPIKLFQEGAYEFLHARGDQWRFFLGHRKAAVLKNPL